MKKLILMAVIGLANTGFTQTYQNDFQKAIGLPNTNINNYTFDQTKDKGYVVVSTVENSITGYETTLVLYELDNNFEVTNSIICDGEFGLYGGLLQATDVIETSENNYLISGKFISEGQVSGGVLIHIKSSKCKLFLDWFKIYPNDFSKGESGVVTITNIIETSKGFMAIGIGKESYRSRGIVFGVNKEGSVLWSNNIYGNQYKLNNQSLLNDIVKISDKEYAVVGSVNSFTVDDSDVLVAILNTDGKVLRRRVYERKNKKYGDGQAAYLEKGDAITYDQKTNSLTIAGVAMKKVEGHCVAVDYRRLLTFQVDANTLNLKWQNLQDIGADRKLNNLGLSCGDIAFDPKTRTYAITGSVLNNAIGNQNYNGYILRVNNKGQAIDLRYYGQYKNDHLNKIQVSKSESGTFISAGTIREKGKKQAWLVESYAKVSTNCHSLVSKVSTHPYSLGFQKSIVKAIDVESQQLECSLSASKYTEIDLCKKTKFAKDVIMQETIIESKTKSTLEPMK